MTEHAQPQKEELKKHGDELEHALNSSSQRASKETKTDPKAQGSNNKE